MRELLRKTWFPTLVFALAAFYYELPPGRMHPLPLGAVTLYVLCVVPPVWWGTTAMHGPVSVARGALGGAICGAVIVLIPAIILGYLVAVQSGDGSAGLIPAVGFFALASTGAVLIPLGAGIGALAALLQGAKVE